ncbi:hypothetical protein NLJ89_g9054 [Agrocybe chaxingu]|uniref:Uncharacterized protein n=1 Tax=Agrocybe chaxingu TaxID=84603 RepID=A0A9W8MRK7_9AGAR|nr:hypothetical protein NLJ89_g9054 [Agrocybe chaxingu]
MVSAIRGSNAPTAPPSTAPSSASSGSPCAASPILLFSSHLTVQIEPPRRVNRTIISHFRSIAEQLGSHDTPRARQDFENAILFLKSQREHKKAALDVFEIPELTERIVVSCRRSDLYALSLSSRVISPVAVRVLWWFLPSPLPVLSLLPGLRYTNGNWCLLRSPTAADWHKFDEYAVHIRTFFALFSSNPFGQPNIEREIFTLLQSYRPFHVLFPQLRSLSLPAMKDTPLGPITPILSPNLRDVRLCCPQYTSSYVQQLLAVAPDVACLHLSGRVSGQDLRQLALFARLRHLSIQFEYDISEDFHHDQIQGLQRLPLSPHLISLEIRSPPRFDRPLLGMMLFCRPLKKLHIHGSAPSINSNLPFAGGLEEAVLHFTDVTISKAVVEPPFKTLLSTSRECLRSIKIVWCGTSSFKQCVQPLLQHPNVEKFTMESDFAYDLDLDGDFLREIVDAWPRLVALVAPCESGGSTKLSAENIATLARLQGLQQLSVLIGHDHVQLPRGPLEAPLRHATKFYLDRYFA